MRGIAVLQMVPGYAPLVRQWIHSAFFRGLSGSQTCQWRVQIPCRSAGGWVIRQVHPIPTLPWSTLKPTSWLVQPHPPTTLCPTLPLNLALRCLVGCRKRLCCVSGGNASPLSTEQLFDDGPCCTSLWFQTLQRAGLHMGLACSHNGHKSQGSGLHRPHTLTDLWGLVVVFVIVV